jgi:phosphohistidine phosphatase SixA
MTRGRRSNRSLLFPLLLLLLGWGGVASPATAQESETTAADCPTTIYVYRHAERVSDTDRDSPLSEKGHARAGALADALALSGITAIHVTPYRRTQQTASPLAERLGLTMEVEGSGDPDGVEGLVRRILERYRGESVLIVGHSNTVPVIVGAFGGPALEEFESSRYGDLFILTVPTIGAVRTVHARVDPAGGVNRHGERRDGH